MDSVLPTQCTLQMGEARQLHHTVATPHYFHFDQCLQNVWQPHPAAC